MANVRTYEVTADEAGIRLDRWFKRHFPGLGHGALEKLLRTGQVRVDGGRVKAGFRLDPGQQVRVPPAAADVDGTKPSRERRHVPVPQADREMLRDLVLHMDDSVIVLNKPSGLAVQGGSRTERHIDGMLDALRFGAKQRPKLVHRLDRDTSGVLLLARSATAAAKLGKTFQSRSARKTYWALTFGVPKPARGHIRAPLAKMASGKEGRERVGVVREGDSRGQRAETLYSVVEHAAQSVAWTAFMPLTGRTHQIRAHAAFIGAPIIGDRKYGGEETLIADLAPRLHLHARAIELPHPDKGTLSISAPLPTHMQDSWRYFGFEPELEENLFEEWEG